MATTYEPIATNTLSSAAASQTFSSIPGTYTDLIVVASLKNVSGASTVCARYNGDTGSNYSFVYMLGDGSSALSGLAANTSFAVQGYANTTQFAPAISQIMNYSNTTTYKTVLDRRGTVAQFVGATVSTWRNTAAITSIVIFNETGGNFESGTTFTLYGIKAA